MARIVHPKPFDGAVPAQARGTKRGVAQHHAVMRGARRAIAVLAVLGLLALFISPIVDEFVGAAAAMSSATPTHAASTRAQYGNGATGYFPDEFVVRNWDESPLPERPSGR